MNSPAPSRRRPLRSLAAFGASVIDGYRAAEAYERTAAGDARRRVLDDVTSGRYRTVL
jgi:hypothetical protein